MKRLNPFLAFHLLFYRGSQIPLEFYNPFIEKLQTKIPIESITFRGTPSFEFWKPSDPLDQNIFEPVHFPNNNTLIVAHSFGGYFALKDVLKDSENVSKIILFGSHTNNANGAIYPSIDEKKVQKPLLILNGSNGPLNSPKFRLKPFTIKIRVDFL